MITIQIGDKTYKPAEYADWIEGEIISSYIQSGELEEVKEK